MVFVPPSSKTGERDAARRHREKAYAARNEVIAVLARLWDSHVTPVKDGPLSTVKDLHEGRAMICIHPPGQEDAPISWVVTTDEVETHFSWMKKIKTSHWDRSQTAAHRSERLRQLANPDAAPVASPAPTPAKAKGKKHATPPPVVTPPPDPLPPRRPGDFSRRRERTE